MPPYRVRQKIAVHPVGARIARPCRASGSGTGGRLIAAPTGAVGISAHKLGEAALVGGHGVGGGGGGAAHHDVVRAEGRGLGGGQRPQLVALVAVCGGGGGGGGVQFVAVV